MIDYNKIAKKYAKEHQCDILHQSAERNGDRYFYLNHKVRPRYMGHPHIIKVGPTGEVQQVLDVDEVYWAYENRLDPTSNLLE